MNKKFKVSIFVIHLIVFILSSTFFYRRNKPKVNPVDPPEAKAALSGQIMVDPNNKSWLVYNRDSNGDGKKDPFFMCGAGEPEEFLYTEGTSYIQANDVINKLSGTGANAVYFELIRTGGDVRPGQPSKQDPFINHNPNTPGADVNLVRQWKTKWLDRMDQLGITMFVFFYDDTVSLGKNNEQFFRDVVNELEGYKNLIWIVGEESIEALSNSDVLRIADWIKKYDDNNHPVGNHQLSGLTFNTPNLDVFAIQKNSGDLHADMVKAWNNANGRYNLVMSESKASFNLSATQLRRFHWGIAMGGAYITELDWWYHGSTGRVPSTQELRNCGNLVSFMERTNFNEMSPNDGLARDQTDYVLASGSSNVSYAIAYANGFSSTMGIRNMTSGAYNLTWYDIVNNVYVERTGISIGSGDQSFSKPGGINGSEVALYIRRTSGGTTPTPTSGCQPGTVPGDANGDCMVDGFDYVIWWQNFGNNVGGGPSQGDFNRDGTTDGFDYVIWWQNFGTGV